MRNLCEEGEKMRKYDVCIFDLDGTLIDSLDDLADSCNKALKIHGLPTHNIDKYRFFVGSGIKNLIKRSLGDMADDHALVQKVYDSFNSVYEQNCLVKTKPYPGIIEMLRTLKQNGVRLCVLSNKSDDFANMITDSLFDKGTFDLVWGKKSEFPIKPDPGSINTMLDKLSISRDKCLYIGDSDVDCITAKNADVDLIGVEWGFRGRNELENAGAEIVVSSPEEIVKAVCVNE